MKKLIEEEFPILKEIQSRIENLVKIPTDSDIGFLNRLQKEYKALVLENKKLKKRIELLNFLIKKDENIHSNEGRPKS